MYILKAENRSTEKKSKQLRREGIIPGIIVGKSLEESLSVQFSKKDITAFLKTHSVGSTVSVTLGAEKYTALLREVSNAPVSFEVEHLRFQVLKGEAVHSTVPVVLLNRELAGGVVHQPISEIAYRARPDDLIEKIEVNVAGLMPGTVIRISDLPVFKNSAIELQTPPERAIAVIHEKKEDPSPEPEANAPAAET